ncbi:MAG: heparinase II/III family protein [Acidobacteriota bacterium]
MEDAASSRTGVMTYDPGDVRSYDRSAAAHSTLTLDGSDQAELWSAFRCGARPTIEAAAAEQDSLTGAYRVRNGGLYRHVRTIELPRRVALLPRRDPCERAPRGDPRLHLAPDTVVEGTSSPLRLLRDAGAVAEVDAPRLP